jgi:glyoxylase-like metal-dependent hydrolase (beta-lactamase superfamily II)
MSGGWRGGRLSNRVTCVLAPNPGPMTLDGTNTYVLAEPGARQVVVVDPGPDDPRHLAAVRAAAGDDGRSVALVLLTHGHADHAAGAGAFAAAAGCRVLAADPAHGQPLPQGTLHVEGLSLTVVPTPGHTADSVCVLMPDERAVLTGDTVLGRGTTVVAHPDGRLGDYLDSLARLTQVVENGWTLLPGHGPAGADVSVTLADYLEHRRQRLREVQAAVARGARDADDVVADVYADVPVEVWPAARLSVLAQLEHLVDTGRLRRTSGGVSAPGA